MTTKPDWTGLRMTQFEDLEALLRDVVAINKGSHVIERLQRCIKRAEELTRSDLNTGEDSFMWFLRGLAAEDRQRQAEKAQGTD